MPINVHYKTSSKTHLRIKFGGRRGDEGGEVVGIKEFQVS